MYHNVDEFESAIENLVLNYHSVAERITMPFWTAGGKRVNCLRIGSRTASGADGVLFLFGQHAREWVPPEIGLNLMADLLPAYANNESLTYGLKTYSAEEIRELVDSINIFIIPCANPDGHLFTQSWEPTADPKEKVDHLTWRKNRNPSHGPQCPGVDLNRNYDFAFKLDKYFNLSVPRVNMYNSSANCSELYQGPNAFSEPETQNIRWLIDTYQRIRWFVDIHAYTQTGEIYYPWGDDENQSERPVMNWQNPEFDHQRGDQGENTYREYMNDSDQLTLRALAKRLQEGVSAVRSSNYQVKQIAQLYAVSGSSTDWIWSRHLLHPSLPRVEGFAIEVQRGASAFPFQDGFQPLPEIKDEIVRDVSSGLINFAMATVWCMGLTAEPDSLNVVFNNIPEGRIASRPVILRVTGCWAATFRVVSDPSKTSGGSGITFGVAVGTSSAPQPAGETEARELYLWLTVQGGLPGQTATGTVRVECPETSETWDVSLNANFVRAPRAGAVLVLDRSASMSEDAGDGRTRLQVLLDSAPAFVQVAPPKTRVGLVRFATDASSGAPMTTIGPEGTDPGGRQVILDAISGHTLATGSAALTSIGDGVYAGTELIEPENDVEFKSLIVLTDGFENRDRYLTDIASLINNRVFAIGLGKAQDIQPIALDTLTNKTGGYMLMTGTFDGNDPYRLAKYYLQILTGVTNDQVVVDPDGWLPVGGERSIPFYLNEADQSVDTIVLTPFPDILEVRLKTPSGEILDKSHPSLKWTKANQMGFFRFTLPVPGESSKQGPGGWQIILGWRNDWKKHWDRLTSKDFFHATAASNSVRYKAMVHARSEVAMAAMLAQNSRTPGAKITLRVRLTQYESVPIEGGTVRAVIEFPDQSLHQVSLNEVGNGVYENKFVAELYGSYPMRISAEGRTLRGFPFTREAWRTALIWRGGDNEPPTGARGGRDLIRDLFDENLLDAAVLKRVGLDIDKLRDLFRPEETEVPIRSRKVKAEEPKLGPGKKRR